VVAPAALHHLGEGLALVGVEDRTDLLEGGDALLHGLREQGLDLGLLGLQGASSAPSEPAGVARPARCAAPCSAASARDVPRWTADCAQLHVAQAELLLQAALPAVGAAPRAVGRIGGVRRAGQAGRPGQVAARTVFDGILIEAHLL
jgi:hypothetical protein